MTEPAAAEHNILIISDVHLGEDLKAVANGKRSPGLDLLERQLVSFLRHYTYQRRDGRPWRLVVNGDLVDFMGISLRPGDERVAHVGELTADDHTYGLARRPNVARAQMEAVVDRHPAFFKALARFIDGGHQVDIIAGNHDSEFQWAAVQHAFREGLRRAWESAQVARGGDPASDHIAAGVAFHPWFFYEPGVAWIEHGHMYDENCSMEFALAPAYPHSNEMIPNVDTASTRYVVNNIPGAGDSGQENWSMLGYIRWAGSLGFGGSYRLARSYYRFSTSLLGVWRRRSKRPGDVEALRERHLNRVRRLCQRWGLEEQTLDAIHELRRRPVFTNVARLLGVLMIDKLILAMLTLVTFLVAMSAGGVAPALAVTALVSGVAWLAAGHLARSRNVDPSVPLMLIPERILRHVDAKYVVFGHTHDALQQSLDNGGTYINTGTWYPSTQPGLLRAFTHACIVHGEAGPEARLCQWRDGASRSFTPGYSVHLPAYTAEELRAIVTQAAPANRSRRDRQTQAA